MTRVMIHDHFWSLVWIVVVVAEQFFCSRWGGGVQFVCAFFTAPSASVTPKGGAALLPLEQRRMSRKSPLRFSETDDDHAPAENSTTTTTTTTTSSTGDDDWRDVRARLIQQFKQQQQAQPGNTDSSSPRLSFIEKATNSSTTCHTANMGTLSSSFSTTTTTSWAYDSGGVIELGSLIVSHPVQDFACGGLRQQWFTKCVVLVVKDDRRFTKGVIVNRNSLSYHVRSSSSFLNPGERTNKSLHQWTVYYGGDVQGIDSPETDYTCLHQLKSPLAQEWSLPVLKDIQHTTWDAAKLLVERGEASPDDFIVFAGYVGWAPDRLQEELEQGNWFTVATDSKSICDLLVNIVGQHPAQQRSTNTAPAVTQMASMEDAMGVRIWKYWMERIGKGHLVENYATTQTFEDNMLNKWMQEKHLTFVPSDQRPTRDPSKNGLIIQPLPDDEKDLPRVVQAGTIYRSIHPIVLDEQVFHRSLVLIVKTDERGSIGVILNRPSSRVTTLLPNIMKGGEQELAVRYGGRYGLEEEGTPETWLHCGNIALQNARVGVPLGATAAADDELRPIIWQCSRQDAEIAVEMGLASPSDFLVTWGFTLWEKNRPPQGLGRPLTTTRLEDEFQPVHKATIPRLWQELLQQRKLSEDTLESNLDHAHAAHEISRSPFLRVTSSTSTGTRSAQDGKDEKTVENPSRRDDDLAEDALRRWIRMFIMGDSRSENV